MLGSRLGGDVGKGMGFTEEFVGVLCSQQEEISVEVL